MTTHNQHSPLPVKSGISTLKYLSISVAVFMGVLSVAGLALPDSFYPSDHLIQSFLPNDVINLVIGIPILVGSIWLTGREKLAGLLLWPGALLYVIYNYLAYIIGIPVNLLTIAYTALVLLSAYIIIKLISQIDSISVKQQLSGKVFEKLAGWFLLIFGILFILRAVNIFVSARLNQIVLPPTEIGVSIADIVISTLWIIGGIYLLRRKPLGYTGGLGLLFAASMLFLGLVVFLIIQPYFTSAHFNLMDVIVVAIMGIFFSIPFALYLRGTLNSS